MLQSSDSLPFTPGTGTINRTHRKKKRTVVAPEVRHQMIAEAAYYLAEKRNFQDGDPVADWLKAESMIERALLAGVKPRLALQFLTWM
jgi:hypothetical protein